MEEHHNDITKPELPAGSEAKAKPELKKPAFLEEKKPEPYKKVKLSFLEKLKKPAVPEEPEPAASPTSHLSWNTDELPVIEDVLGIMDSPASEDTQTEDPAKEVSAEEKPAGDEAAGNEPAEEGSAEEEPAEEEPVEEESAEEEPAEEEPAVEEPAEEEPAEEEPAVEEPAEPVPETEEPAVPREFASHTDWNTDELPVIEDVLGLEESGAEVPVKEEPAEEIAPDEEKKAEKPAFLIPFFGDKKDEEEEEPSEEKEQDTDEEEEEQEEEKKLPLKMPSGSVKSILIAGVVILAIILIYSVIQSRRIYHSYEVMSAVVSSDDASTSYQVNKYGMIRYSNNGIALTDKSGNVIWNQTYEMNNPIIAAAGNYIAVGDRGASTLYIFNQYGQCGKLTTDLPLQGMQMAENGVVAAILSDSESNFINLYDKQGSRLVGIRATLENTGYPLAVGVSPDASKLVVSYLTVSESAKTQTKLVFYDFGTLNGEHEKLTGLLNDLCPRIQFLGRNRVAVFREKGFDIYSVDGEVKMVFSTEFEDEIRSIFTDEQTIGFIFRNRDDNGKFRIELYDVSGQKSMTIYSDLDYSDIRSDSDEVVLFNNSRAEIYKYNGKQVFGGDFENRISAIMPSWDTGMYWLVEDSRLCEIRVK